MRLYLLELSIIIVNWNTGDLLNNCISSILDKINKNLSYEIIVVDNNSTDESIELVRKNHSSTGKLRIIEEKENHGFSKGNNIGVNNSNGQYILFLNPDTIILENSVEKMLRFYKNNQKKMNIGILAPKLLNIDGSVQHSVNSFPMFSFNKIYKLFKNKFSKSAKKINYPHIIDWARGACLLISRDVGERLGFWNEEFPIYGEDLELCYRYKLHGYNTVYTPQISIIHHFNQSGKKRWSNIESLITKRKSLKIFYEIYFSNRKFIFDETISLLYNLIKYKITKKNKFKANFLVNKILIKKSILG